MNIHDSFNFDWARLNEWLLSFTKVKQDMSFLCRYNHRTKHLVKDALSCLPIADYVKKYATEEALREQEEMESSSESSMSDFSEDEAQDMEL